MLLSLKSPLHVFRASTTLRRVFRSVLNPASFLFFFPPNSSLITSEEEFVSGLNSSPASTFGVRLQRYVLKKNPVSVETLEVTSIRGTHLFLPRSLPHAVAIPGSFPARAAVGAVPLQQ